MPMTVGIVTCELHLPTSRSLKEKRKLVHSVVDRLHARFRVSVAETEFHDLVQRAEIGVALVANGAQEIDRLMQTMRAIVEDQAEASQAMVTDWHPQILEAEG